MPLLDLWIGLQEPVADAPPVDAREARRRQTAKARLAAIKKKKPGVRDKGGELITKERWSKTIALSTKIRSAVQSKRGIRAIKATEINKTHFVKVYRHFKLFCKCAEEKLHCKLQYSFGVNVIDDHSQKCAPSLGSMLAKLVLVFAPHF
jgi:hypothetical protein